MHAVTMHGNDMAAAEGHVHDHVVNNAISRDTVTSVTY
jgi:hypothetical protein